MTIAQTPRDDADVEEIEACLAHLAATTTPRAGFLDAHHAAVQQAAGISASRHVPVAARGKRAGDAHPLPILALPRAIFVRPHRPPPLLRALSVAAVIVLFVSIAGSLWRVERPRPVSAQGVLTQAISRSGADLTSAGIRSYHITSRWTFQLADSGGRTLPTTVTEEQWGITPDRWRIDQTVETTEGLYTYGSVASIASDGTTLWSSRTETGQPPPQPPVAATRHIAPAAQRQAEPPGPGGTKPMGTSVSVGALPDGVATRLPTVSFAPALPLGTEATPPQSAGDVLDQARRCYQPQFQGEASVAGREAYVVNLGASSCPSSYELKPSGTVVPGTPRPTTEQGRYMMWIDKETFVVLKSERDNADGTPQARYEVTAISYDQSYPDDLFTYQPPAGAHITDVRPQAYQPQSGVPMPVSILYKNGQRRPTIPLPSLPSP